MTVRARIPGLRVLRERRGATTRRGGGGATAEAAAAISGMGLTV